MPSTYVTERIFQAFGRFWKAVFHFFLRRAAFGISTGKKKGQERKRDSEKEAKAMIYVKSKIEGDVLGMIELTLKIFHRTFCAGCW